MQMTNGKKPHRVVSMVLLVLLISTLACGTSDPAQETVESVVNGDAPAEDTEEAQAEGPADPATSLEDAVPNGITSVETDDPAGDSGGAADHAYFMIGYDSTSIYVAIGLHAPGDLDGTRVYSDREPSLFGYQARILAADGGGYEVQISSDEGNAGLYNNMLGNGQVLGSGDDFIVFSFPREYVPTLLEHNFWLVSGFGDAMDLTPGQGSRGPWLSFSN
jgi:hypothetical protein